MSTETFLVTGIVLVISGMLLIIGGILTAIRTRRRYSTWRSARGTVTRVVSRSISPANFHYYPEIKFQTPAGKVVHFECELGFFPAKHKKGQSVPVWYDATHPEQAMLDLAPAKWGKALALGIFGGTGMLLGGSILVLV